MSLLRNTQGDGKANPLERFSSSFWTLPKGHLLQEAFLIPAGCSVMPALCHSFIKLTILSGASPRWFPVGCKALSSGAGGLLTALSLHLPEVVPSRGPPQEEPRKG